MTDYETFGVGGSRFPLTASTAKTLLEDADPSVFHITGYLEAVITAYVGARLDAEGTLHGINFPNAVEQTTTIEPAPHLLAEDLSLPVLAVYRREDQIVERSTGWETTQGTIEFAWVLPPLTPYQANKLTPILRGVARVIAQRVRHGADSSYLAGADVWNAAGIERIQVDSMRYGAWAHIDETGNAYRALVGTITVWERDNYDLETDFQAIDGHNVHIDLTAKDGSQILDFIEINTFPAPTIASLDVATGSKAGGTAVTITGTNFVVGTTPRVIFGTEDASDVIVTSTTTVTCVTPAHGAFPTEIVDVYLVAADGQESNTLTNAFTFTTP